MAALRQGDTTAGHGDAAVPLRSLRAVAAVASAGSVSRAAQALHQSSAAVTRAVQGAEQALGVMLFERGARGMVPTAPGEALALRVSRAFEALQAGANGLRARGAPPAVASLPRLVSDALLQALVARGTHPSEAAAAAAVGLSQPALHQALRRLEHAAKTTLYERSRLGARLNESGEFLVTIGSLPMATDVLVPQAAARVLVTHPALHIDVKDGTYESLTRLLRNADVDFVVGPLRGDALAGDLEEEVLYVDRFVAAVRQGHPLLRGGRRASLRRLAPYPWIGPLAGTPAHGVFERLFAQAGLPLPAVALRAHSTAVVRSVLLAGDHVALVGLRPVEELRAGGLRCARA